MTVGGRVGALRIDDPDTVGDAVGIRLDRGRLDRELALRGLTAHELSALATIPRISLLDVAIPRLDEGERVLLRSLLDALNGQEAGARIAMEAATSLRTALLDGLVAGVLQLSPSSNRSSRQQRKGEANSQ